MNQQNVDRYQRLQAGILKIHNKSFPVYEGVNTVGRQREAIVNIKHLNISQNHAVVVIKDGTHFISDLNSSNGSFIANRKVEPFKLYELKHNTEIKLGDLNGSYITEGPFTNNDQTCFEMTQDVTQSFYGSNTQIVDISKANNTENEFEDIHEAPTQEISWAAFKIPKNIKPVNKDVSQVARQKENSKVPSEKSEEDIYNCNTQVISEPASSNEKKSVDASIKPNISNDDEDIHDAPTQIFPISSNYIETVNPIVPEPEIFGPFDDECLPFLEDNDNYNEVIEIPEIDKASDIHEAETQVVDICKNSKSTITETNMEDDEATDCEDITNIELSDRKANPELPDKKPGPTNTLISNQDEETDCEDNTQDDRVEPSSGQQNKNGFLQSDEGSNDSMEFFKLDRSNNKDSKETINKAETDVLEESNKERNNKSNNSSLDQPKLNVQMDNSSDESIRFKKKKRSLISDTDSEDEQIGYKRKNKSAMVISTQDICENDLGTNSPNLNTGTNLDEAIDDGKKLRSRDSYIINDTDSETEVELESKVCLEESIAPTQNQSTADLNDTDCIPATQDVITECTAKLKSKGPKRLSDNINGSSEESFKLGLTELMDNPSQVMGNNASSQDPCCSKTYKNPSPIFGKSSSKNRTSPNENLLKDTADTDIYLLSTQKIVEIEIRSDRINKTSLDNQSALDMYLAPTQKIVIPEKLSEKEEDNLNETECFYDMPTQKVDVKEIKNHTAINKSFDGTNNDTFLAPTQKVLSEIPKKINETPENNLNETECLYDLCTQKIDVRDLENPIDTKSQLDGTNNDIYFAPTQKIFNEVAHTDKDSSLEESMDVLFLQATQQSDDIFNQPTQKVNKSDIETESKKKDNTHSKPNLVAKEPEIISLQSKKKFSFKKQVSNLDGSLTSILDHKPVQSQSIGREKDRSSIEIEFSDNAFNETADRPSNPLSYILDNPCQVNNPLETEGKVIINEIPLEEKFTPEDENNQEKVGKHINIDAEQNVSVQCRNDTKTDNNVGEVKGKINMTLTTSSKDKINVPLKLGKTRSSRQSCVNEALESKNKSDLKKLELQSTINEVNKKTEIESDIRPPRRRTKRLYSSSSDIKTNSNLDIEENKLQVKTEQTDNSLNATNSEVNQTVALLESKVTRTRKTMKSSEVQVKVPKNRKSMSILDIDAIPESSDKYQNINNNVVSKITRERKSNKNNKLNDDAMKSYPSTSKSITSKKREGSKLRQSEDRKIDVKVEANNNSETSEQTCPPLEIMKEEGSDVISSDTQNTRRMRKASAPTSKETRQVGKRKHPADKKPDDNDSDAHSSDINLTTPKKRKQQPSRQVGKRKQITEVKSENSDSSIHSVDSNLVTPKKQKIEPNEALLNTKERGLRKQKPKVVFTMLESPQLESMIKQLGGSVVDTVDACTVLVTEHVKRSQKLLAAVGLGKPICSPKWITDSKKAHEFLDPWDYILTDKEAETKWKFSLKESLNRSRTKQLLDTYNFNIQVTNAAEVLKGAIESCGGKCITKIPSQPLENTFIISTSETRGKHKKITKQHSNIKVIEPEAIFDGVLRQELRFSKHYLT